MDLDAAVERAVDECIREGILRDFLRKNRLEVIAMSIFEYDKEEEEKKLRRAEYEAGLEAGEESKAKETAILLFQEGDSIEKIARVLKVSENIIRQWLDK
ncbi:helix-turn-helix domain-containing protein [Blautia sp. MSJ-19]|uniref:helix-turn-helix domain-containing protein n=1 Tax=Blautia sp. MSJ-19 TaxID=2841517 RepID=UPI001C0F0C75|nr:helix-turn-helix domain-containing protein [Blautia sp. MSJ-19]MBU5480992.1 helix-turn-helix domain-containing protein [Blautia sp. MSJ-19]